jgi:hypothetical protein
MILGSWERWSLPLTSGGNWGDEHAAYRAALLAAMRRMGIAKDEMSGHGFRAMARAILKGSRPIDI